MNRVTTKLTLSVACLLAATVAANASPYVLTLDQVGSNVVATGSGEFDLTGLTFNGGTSIAIGAFTIPSLGRILTGPAGGLDDYVGMSGPTNFGAGSFSSASSASGNPVVLEASPLEALLVPSGYTSGLLLSDSATYNNATFASLGLTPGTYKWTWGRHADQSFTLEIGQPSAVPGPTSGAGLPGIVFAIGGLLFWSRRKQHASADRSAAGSLMAA